jgi:hypothetical protein
MTNQTGPTEQIDIADRVDEDENEPVLQVDRLQCQCMLHKTNHGKKKKKKKKSMKVRILHVRFYSGGAG